jgi:DNA (cytosine-5)-methyltransferase 1
MASRYDALGMPAQATHAREMAGRSRGAGRSLIEVTDVAIQQTDDRPRELALFAGSGGGILGGKLLGWRCVCAVELDLYAASVLLARQNDGTLAPFPIWDDVRTFDGRPWRGIVDVVSGGFPCQDISVAGRGAGITGEKSGLWREFARIISEVRPPVVFVENSPALVTRGLGVVLGDLSALGYDAKWGVVSAENAGAPHKRERLWIVANANRSRELQPKRRIVEQRGRFGDGPWWPAEPDVVRVVHGVTARVDRIRCLGNGQVPVVARLAFELLQR